MAATAQLAEPYGTAGASRAVARALGSYYPHLPAALRAARRAGIYTDLRRFFGRIFFERVSWGCGDWGGGLTQRRGGAKGTGWGREHDWFVLGEGTGFRAGVGWWFSIV